MTIEITSFSFRDGYPKDLSDHGGGFVFDCRLLYNPGIVADLMQYHGKEQPVVDYLDKQPAVKEFAKHVFAVIDQAIAEYQQRDFDHLSVSFGCTGGKHRSVYMAERTAEHIRQKFPAVKVELTHSKGW